MGILHPHRSGEKKIGWRLGVISDKEIDDAGLFKEGRGKMNGQQTPYYQGLESFGVLPDRSIDTARVVSTTARERLIRKRLPLPL